MKFIKLIFGIVILASLSCKKDKTASVEAVETSSTVSVKNGMLAFSTQKALDSTIILLEKMAPKDVDAWMKSFDYESLDKDTSDNPVAVVYDPFFRKILNNNASLIVGGQIFLIKDNIEYLIKDGDLNVYSKILGNQLESISSNKSVYTNKVNLEIKERVLNKVDKSQILEVGGPVTGQRGFSSPEYNNGRREKVYMELYAQSFVVNASLGARMRGEAYRSGGVLGRKKWREDELYMGRMHGIYGSMYDPIFRFDTGVVYNTNEMDVVFHRWGPDSGGVPSRPTLYSCSVTFEYQKASNNPAGSFYYEIR